MRSIVFFCCVTITHLVSAQNWKPFTFHETYYYISDTSAVIDVAYRVDSISLTGSDSIGYLNRILKDIPDNDCMDNAGQYWLSSMTKVDEGIYLFSNPNTKVLHTQAQVGEFWTFTTDPVVTAQVNNIDTATIFGSIDSIKTIHLSTGDSILLSQNHGLISFPMQENADAVYTHLSGIGGRNVGSRLPEFRDYFDWHVGDLFQWEIWEMWDDMGGDYGGSLSIFKVEVLQSALTDTLATIEIVGNRFYEYFTDMGGSTSLIPIHDTLFIRRARNSFTYALPGQYVPLVADLPGIMDYDDFYSIDVLKEYTIDSTGITTLTELYCDEYLSYYYPADGLICPTYSYSSCMQYKVGLGWTFWKEEGVDTYMDFELTAYRKDGDTVGLFIVDSEFVVSLSTPEVVNLKVYPNPASGQLLCDLPPDVNEIEFVHLISISGVMYSVNFKRSNEQLMLDVSGLPAGMYVFKCGNSSLTMTSDIVIITSGGH